MLRIFIWNIIITCYRNSFLSTHNFENLYKETLNPTQKYDFLPHDHVICKHHHGSVILMGCIVSLYHFFSFSAVSHRHADLSVPKSIFFELYPFYNERNDLTHLWFHVVYLREIRTKLSSNRASFESSLRLSSNQKYCDQTVETKTEKNINRDIFLI